MEWYSIETAPKDGTAILAVVVGFQPVVAEWDDAVGWWYGEEDTPEAEGWEEDIPYYPTHWTPLLNVPKKEQ